MALDTNSDVRNIEGRGTARERLTNGPEDIRNGTEALLTTGDGAPASATLYIETEGAVEITVELSHDGETFREPASEMPIEFDGPGTEIILIQYDAAAVRVSASNSTLVDVDLRVTA